MKHAATLGKFSADVALDAFVDAHVEKEPLTIIADG